MTRVRAADDFEAIRRRMEELRRQRHERYGRHSPAEEASPPELDAIAHVPGHVVRRVLAEKRRSLPR